jgi:hypothetical protein
LEIKPDNAVALHRLGTLYLNEKQYEKASFNLQLPLLMDPNYPLKESLLEKINECSKHLK